MVSDSSAVSILLLGIQLRRRLILPYVSAAQSSISRIDQGNRQTGILAVQMHKSPVYGQPPQRKHCLHLFRKKVGLPVKLSRLQIQDADHILQIIQCPLLPGNTVRKIQLSIRLCPHNTFRHIIRIQAAQALSVEPIDTILGSLNIVALSGRIIPEIHGFINGPYHAGVRRRPNILTSFDKLHGDFHLGAVLLKGVGNRGPASFSHIRRSALRRYVPVSPGGRLIGILGLALTRSQVQQQNCRRHRIRILSIIFRAESGYQMAQNHTVKVCGIACIFIAEIIFSGFPVQLFKGILIGNGIIFCQKLMIHIIQAVLFHQLHHLHFHHF